MKHSIFIFLLAIIFSSNCGIRKVPNIKIVDVANLDRAGIAREVEILDSLGAAVIVVDIQFTKVTNSPADSLLNSAFAKCSKLVLASTIVDEYKGEDKNYKTLGGTNSFFLTDASTGFINVILDDDKHKLLSRFSIAEQVGGKKEYCLAMQAVLLYDSLKARNFESQHPKINNLEYAGGVNAFTVFRANDVLNNKLSAEDVRGSLIFLGSFSILDKDAFYTPLGKAINFESPDMYGVVYHANVAHHIMKYGVRK